MLRNVNSLLSLAAAGLAIVAATSLAGDWALANGKSNGQLRPAAMPTSVGSGGGYASHHQPVLRIADSQIPSTKAVMLGRNKSMLIDLPRELRDVVVSNPEVMDAVVQTSSQVYLIGKKTGQSNAFFFDVNGNQILTLEVVIEQDASALDAMLRRLIPGSNIKTEVLNDTLILTGTVRSPIDSTRAYDIATRYAVSPTPASDERHKAKVINMLGVEGEEQVMLKVTVAEVQRSLLKQFGMNVGALVTSGNFATSVLTENSLPLTAARGLGTLATPGIATIGTGVGALRLYNQGPSNAGDAPFGNSGTSNFYDLGSRGRISHTLRALERIGLIKTLAEPNLTAVSGETAKFLAGGEYPIPVVDGQGALSVSFKEFGVGLAFTPVVLTEGRISLKIETEVSELTTQGSVTLSSISIPALKKRQAKSTVELPSGGSLALAGLISDDLRQNIDGFPGLKDVPVLGTLFRSRDFIKEETELVVIVTPYLVKATSREQLGRPDDGLAAATERKGNFLGHLNRIYGRGQAMPDGGLKGSYGFIVE